LWRSVVELAHRGAVYLLPGRAALWDGRGDVSAFAAFTIDISAVGAERHDDNVGVAALSIPLPTARFVDQEERLIQMLPRTCAEVSAALGANEFAGS
jgi:hypothetical protein